MKLYKIIIEDFKSIKREEIDLNNLTCLVGQNESGKSNILEAISYLDYNKRLLTNNLTNKNSIRYDEGKTPKITGYFTITSPDSLTETFDIYNETDEIIVEEGDSLKIEINSDKLDEINIYLIKNVNELNLDLLFENKSNYVDLVRSLASSYLPKIEIFHSDELTITPITTTELNDSNPNAISFLRLLSLGGIENLNEILSDPERGLDKLNLANDRINEIFSGFYSQDKSIKIELTLFANQLQLKFKDSSRRTYSLSERSLGFKYFFSFLINKKFLSTKTGEFQIYLLDEPGNSLHPKGAKDLLKIFNELCTTDRDQIIYTTHNPFLTFRENPDKLLLVRKDAQNGTTIHRKAFSNKYEILRKELGIVLNDSFLVGEINLVVEGNSDKYLFHRLIDELEDFQELTWINIFSADSSSEVIPSVRFLKSMFLKGLVILDDDEAAKKEINKPKFKEYIVDSLDWNYLTITGGNGENLTQKTIEDLLEPKVYIEAYNTYYETEAYDVYGKDFVPMKYEDLMHPILNQVKDHHKKCYGSEQINKMGIFRKLLDLYPISENNAIYKSHISLLRKIKTKISKL